MADKQTVFQVTPDEGSWRIEKDGEQLLVVQSKDVAIEEAVVQARQVPDSKIVIRAADGSVEEEASYGAGTPTPASA